MIRAGDLGEPVRQAAVWQAAERHEVELRTSDGVSLCGRWWAVADGTEATCTVVVVHGFSASQMDPAVNALARSLHAANYNVLTYDARGHGASSGLSAVGMSEHLDVACAVERAAEEGDPIVLVGVSMGAIAVVNHLANGSAGPGPVVGAVLVSAPARWRMRISPVGVLTAALTRTRGGRWIAARRLRVRVARGWRVGEPLETAVQRVTLPLAIVHGTQDRLLATTNGRQLHASAFGPCRLDIVRQMGHGVDVAGRPAVLDAVRWVLGLEGVALFAP